MRSITRFIFLALTILFFQNARGQDVRERRQVVLTVRLQNDAITPVTVRFLRRAMREAEQKQAECLVIFLDTPGGLVDSTREIVKDILQSQTPIVVYVAPTGARAASAGFFIALASHIAAMAPGTNIGAAHPVEISGTPFPSPQPQPESPEERKPTSERSTPMEDKIVSDTAAWAQALAELRGRNIDWSVRAVRESMSASAGDAVKAGVVDLVAEDLTDLLNKIDGRDVATVHGSVRLHTAAAGVEQLDMWWGEKLLSTIANPNIAFLLIILGFYGILFELYTPGLGVSGIAGLISIVLGFFALAVLPTNTVGLVLILIAFALFVAEAFIVSYGILTLAGIACMIVGGLMLVDSPVGLPKISLSLLVSISVATAAIAVFLLGKIIRSSHLSVLTGAEAMMGATAIAQHDFQNHRQWYEGVVRIHGEIWLARSPMPVDAGDAVKVTSRDGLTLWVRPLAAVAVQRENQLDPTKHIA